jgi:hypothetical protein
MLERINPERSAMLQEMAAASVKERFALYQQMAANKVNRIRRIHLIHTSTSQPDFPP